LDAEYLGHFVETITMKSFILAAMNSISLSVNALTTVQRIRRLFTSLLAPGFIALALPTSAAVYYVSPGGNDQSNNGLSWRTAFASLAKAAAEANGDDQVWVEAGTYGPAQFWNGCQLYGGFSGSETHLSQRNWTTNVTTINGGGGANALLTGQGGNAIVDGFTITNALVGIEVSWTPSVLISHNIVTLNSNRGIHCYQASAQITSNTVTLNGSGLVFTNSLCNVSNNTLSYNTNSGMGCYQCTTVLVTGNMVTNNTGALCGGIDINGNNYAGSVTLTNNTVTGNVAVPGQGQAGGVVIVGMNGTVSLSGNHITKNSSTDANGAGGLILYDNTTLDLKNNIISGNSGADTGGAIIGNTALTMTGNSVDSNVGGTTVGGVRCDATTGQVTNKNLITNNKGNAGGIYVDLGTLEISSNTISTNTGVTGGGVSLSNTTPALLYNIVSGNRATTAGGGISFDSSTATIANNVIQNNNAPSGSGIYILNVVSSLVANNTLVSNLGSAALQIVNSGPAIENNILYSNTSGIKSDTTLGIIKRNCFYNNGVLSDGQLLPGAEDIIASPCFVSGTHLSTWSPCIDAGDDSIVLPNWTDMDGNPRTYGPHVDIGAYECQADHVYRGVDVSQEQSPALWPKLKSAGWDFAFVDVYYKGPYTGGYASVAPVNVSGASAAGMKVGVYMPLEYSATSNGTAQVNNAIKALGTQLKNVVAFAIDVEDYSGVPPMTPALVQRAIQYIGQAVAAIQQAKLKPIIYSNSLYWQKYTNTSTQFSAANIPLWLTKPDNVGQLTSAGFGGWTAPTGKQFMATANLFSQVTATYNPKTDANTDLDVFATGWLP
jgi:GH25 family lysozyme M1 (1,4-beta-N-acetylmuramidase)